MNFNLDIVMQALSVIVIPIGIWAIKLQRQVDALERHCQHQVDTLAKDFQGELHQLEKDLRATMVPAEQLQALETRLERRLDRYDQKLDEVLGLIRRSFTENEPRR